MDRKYEIIVYGATGFTGQICCKYLRDNYKDLVWAMAGRNEEKLAQDTEGYFLVKSKKNQDIKQFSNKKDVLKQKFR